jgi:hypothetical protein
MHMNSSMTQRVDGRLKGRGRWRTSRTPFNIKIEENVEKISEIVRHKIKI